MNAAIDIRIGKILACANFLAIARQSESKVILEFVENEVAKIAESMSRSKSFIQAVELAAKRILEKDNS